MGLISNAPTGKKPGKGVMLPLNADVARLFIIWSEDIVSAIGAAGDFDTLRKLLSEKEGWTIEDDDFGKKVYFESGAYRLTVVETARSKDLMVDIRNWS